MRRSTSAATPTITNVNDPPTGGVTLSGVAQEDQTITANASSIADDDGLGSFNYQWQQSSDGINWNNISAATASAFIPSDAQVGQQLRVQVSYTDGQGTVETVTSAATPAITNINDSPTGSVTISGSTQEDQTLTANTASIADDDGLGVFSYQWQQSSDGINWNNISAATASAFTPSDAQVGQQLRVQVSYTDGQGTAESVTSAATVTITNINDPPTGSVTLSGTAAENQTLTADASGIADDDGLGTFSYQWQQSSDGINWNNISGATSNTFIPDDPQVGQVLRVQVSYTDGQGTGETVSSGATPPITNVNDPPTGSITISGSPQEDQTLTANASGIADEDGLGAFSYQWQQSSDGVNWNDISSATAIALTPGDAQVGEQLRVQVSYTDGQGTVETVASAATAAITNINDVPTGSVTVSGTATENQTLTADASGIADDDGLGAFSYQWQQSSDGINWNNISGANSSVFIPDDPQVGQLVRAQVSYTDGQGTGETVNSAATATITNINDAPTGSITISGSPQEDQTLTANASGLADEDGLGVFSYQWQQSSDGVNWNNISGATAIAFAPGDAQVGEQLRVQVSYTDGQGTAEAVTSAATAAIANVNDTPTGGVAISGVAQEDQTLTADASSIADDDGLGVFSYQWQQSADGSIWNNISGATANTFVPSDAQVGDQIRAQVIYTDGQGTVETVTSSATAAIANVNDPPAGSVTISGVAQEDQILTADTSGLSDDDGLGTFTYQWQQSTDGVNWTDISGAIANSFTASDDQVGDRVRVRVSYTDGQGTNENGH